MVSLTTSLFLSSMENGASQKWIQEWRTLARVLVHFEQLDELLFLRGCREEVSLLVWRHSFCVVESDQVPCVAEKHADAFYLRRAN